MSEGQVASVSVFSMQVCVPKDWTDEQAEEFANAAVACGTRKGWTIRKQEDYAAEGPGAQERVQCGDDPERVHILLDA